MSRKTAYPMTMFNLLRAVYWYDEALQANLRPDDWPQVTRTQSMLFANIALGETRPARLAEKMGMTRQSMSQLIASLVDRQILVTRPDPQDRRALKVSFHPQSEPLRNAAEAVLVALHDYLKQQLGPHNVARLDAVLEADWGKIPDIRSEIRSTIPSPDCRAKNT